MEKRFPIGIAKALCPICGKSHDTGVVLGRVALENSKANALESLLLEPTEYQICDTCGPLTLHSFALVEFDEKLTINDIPFRTGHIVWIKPSLAIQLFNAVSFKELSTNKWMYANQDIINLIQKINDDNVTDGESPAENGEDC